MTSPEAGNDRRFPQRFVTVDWSTPVSNKLLIEASGIHRVERWGGMEPQVGKLGNIDHLEPGMISVADSLNPVTGTPLTYRAAVTYNNSWNWNVHYRAAVSYITGAHTFKVGFNNAFLHHENTTYSAPATPYSYGFTSMEPTSITYRIVPRTVEVNVDRDMGFFAGQMDDRTLDTGRGPPPRFLQEQLPSSGDLRHVLRTEPERLVPRDREFELERHHAEIGCDLRRIWKREDGVEGDSQQVSRRPGYDGFGPAQVSDAPNPILRVANQTTQRTWADGNRNFIPDCDLNNFAPMASVVSSTIRTSAPTSLAPPTTPT